MADAELLILLLRDPRSSLTVRPGVSALDMSHAAVDDGGVIPRINNAVASVLANP